MYRVITTIWLSLLALSGINAQDPVDFNTFNTETYSLYQQQKWDSLIDMGREALKQDYDFYYLRMRLSIALYNQKNFRKAGVHFTKALAMNQGDPVALEYLYYSRLLAGQGDQANLVREQFKGDLALKLPPFKGKFFDRLGAEYLYNRGMIDHISTNPEETFPGLPSGVQYITHHFSNVSLSLTNSIAPGFSLHHAYTFMTKTNLQYYNDGNMQYFVDNQNVTQHQYYLSPRFTTQSGFKIMPMFHRINGKYQIPVETSGSGGGYSRAYLYYVEYIDYVAGLGLSHSLGSFNLTLGAWYATLNDSEQVQNRLGLTWYPKGNLNFYASAYMNSQYEITEGEAVLRWIPEMHIGFSISEKLWFDLNGTMGEMTNYLENNGQIVYNSFSETIQQKIKFTISIPVSEKGSLLYLGGRWTSNISEFYPLVYDLTGTTNTKSYNTLSFYGGISWKF